MWKKFAKNLSQKRTKYLPHFSYRPFVGSPGDYNGDHFDYSKIIEKKK